MKSLRRSAPALGLILGALLCSSAPAQSLSPSKLSAHLINGYTGGASNIITGHPRVLKVLGLDSGFPSGMVQAMRDYKARVPGGKIVVRIYSAKTYSLTDNASASAADFWNNILLKGLNYLSASDRALIDYLEGPNEGQTPTLGYPGSAPLQASQWFNQFWTNLTPKIVAAGYKPCLGSIAVGNPAGSTAQMQSYLAAFVPALRQTQAAAGAWSYHAYTIDYTTDINDEVWYSLRYRQFYTFFAAAYPDLAAMPLILTEGGVDQSGSPTTSGWQARGTAGDYERWLNWFDQQLQQDSYVLGCTLFEIGNPESWGWPSFDLEPIAGWMRNYLTPPASLPPPPAPISAVASGGHVIVSWTNAPLTPTTWNVKRSTNSSGAFVTIASNLNTGVRGMSVTDAAVKNYITYYYQVTAVNALGEGAPATVSVTPAPPATSGFNCGGSAIQNFQADAFFSGGTAYSTTSGIATNGVVNPAPVAVYQSQRYGTLIYSFPFLVPGATYKVRLHFAEVYWTSVNQRLFNVYLNGTEVLTNFDIVQAAGGANRANVQEFRAVASSTGGISVRLLSVKDNASINGIELLFSSPPPPVLSSLSLSNNVASFAWSAVPGMTYQVQYKDDLAQTNWTNLGSPIIASGPTISVSDPASATGQRFYQVLVTN